MLVKEVLPFNLLESVLIYTEMVSLISLCFYTRIPTLSVQVFCRNWQLFQQYLLMPSNQPKAIVRF